eukprot:6532557-Prymnesium_polylepis.1
MGLHAIRAPPTSTPRWTCLVGRAVCGALRRLGPEQCVGRDVREGGLPCTCLLYTSPSPRDAHES